ncbi:hypothetical protein DRQ33_02895 [bacterium]|nr:MAG: hypothetical protein DRQ33_02895 [bacterium]
MEKYMKPALIAGVVGGVLSAIPFINFANCCCLWVILPVLWAAYMYKQEFKSVDVGPGAALGAITGGVIGIVSGILSVAVWGVFGSQYKQMIMRMFQNFEVPAQTWQNIGSMAPSVFSILSGFVIYIIIGTVVGLIIGAIWKRKPESEIIAMPETPPEVPPQENKPIE